MLGNLPDTGGAHLKCILRLCVSAQAVRNGGQQPVRRGDRARSGVQQHEAARAVRALGGAGAAALAQHRRLLVAQGACQGQRASSIDLGFSGILFSH